MAERVPLGGAIVELSDEGSGEPVVLLHGFPATHRLWAGVIPELVRGGHRAIAPDLVGHGRSEPEAGQDIGMARQAAWLLELFDRLELRRVALVAHDVGTAAAQLLAARAPARVRRLVLMDGVCGQEWAMGAIASLVQWDPAQAGRLFAVLVRTLRTSGRARLDDALVRDVLAPYQGQEGGLKALRAARALDPRETAEVLPALARAGVPIHLLWGDDDRYLPAATVGRQLAAALDAKLETLPGGHFLPLEQPREVAAALLRYLGR